MPPSEVVRIADPESGASARVLVSQGFNCFSWSPVAGGEPREALWAPPGFESGEGRASSGGTPLLFPFPGRIGKGRFPFGGKEYQLPEGDGRGNAIHGFAFTRPWRLKSQGESAVAAEFQASVDAPETLDLWPSDYRLLAEYTVRGNRLVLTLEYSNVGDEPMPCGFGTHAYFRVPLAEGSGLEHVELVAPVDGSYPSEAMIPTGEVEALGADTPLPTGATLADAQFDTPFRVVAADQSRLVTEVRDRAAGLVLRQTATGDFPCLVIYTPPHREAVCLEPYTCVPDPLRLTDEGIDAGLQVLAPGESRRVVATLEMLTL